MLRSQRARMLLGSALFLTACVSAERHLLEAERLESRDPEAAAVRYDAACRSGLGEACLGLGLLLGEQSGRDGEAALAMRRGCMLGKGLACFFAGEWFSRSTSTRSLFQRGCRLGHGPSCARAGIHVRALTLLVPRCHGPPSDPSACHYAGLSARALGRGALALRLQRVGCAARIPAACKAVRALETLSP